MTDFWLIILVIALIANVYCMFKFWQSYRAFNESRRRLNDLIKRIGTP
jgi:hypothetical protein